LIPLPKLPYVISTWKKAKVTNNSHIILGKCYYSVAYQYIRETVDVKICANELFIYHKLLKLCEHKLIKDKIGVYVTEITHMPANSNIHSEWSSE